MLFQQSSSSATGERKGKDRKRGKEDGEGPALLLHPVSALIMGGRKKKKRGEEKSFPEGDKEWAYPALFPDMHWKPEPHGREGERRGKGHSKEDEQKVLFSSFPTFAKSRRREERKRRETLEGGRGGTPSLLPPRAIAAMAQRGGKKKKKKEKRNRIPERRGKRERGISSSSKRGNFYRAIPTEGRKEKRKEGKGSKEKNTPPFPYFLSLRRC